MRRVQEHTTLAIGMMLVVGCANKNVSLFPNQQTAGRRIVDARMLDAPMAETPRILPQTRFAAARMFEHQGRWSKAIVQYRKVIADDRHHVEAYHHLGVLLSRIGRHDDAIEALQAAVELRPDNAVLRNNLGFELMFREQWAEAEWMLRSAIDHSPRFERAHVNLALALSKQGRFDEALAEFRTVLPRTDAYYNLGLMHRGQGDYLAAADAFRTVLKLNPRFGAARKQLDQLEPRLAQVERERALRGQSLPDTTLHPARSSATMKTALTHSGGGLNVRDTRTASLRTPPYSNVGGRRNVDRYLYGHPATARAGHGTQGSITTDSRTREYDKWQLDGTRDLSALAAIIDNEVTCLMEATREQTEPHENAWFVDEQQQVTWIDEADLMSSPQQQVATLVSTWNSGIRHEPSVAQEGSRPDWWSQDGAGVSVWSSDLGDQRGTDLTWPHRLQSLEAELSEIRSDIDCLDEELDDVHQKPERPTAVAPVSSTPDSIVPQKRMPLMGPPAPRQSRKIGKPRAEAPPANWSGLKSRHMSPPRMFDSHMPARTTARQELFAELLDLLSVVENDLACEDARADEPIHRQTGKAARLASYH